MELTPSEPQAFWFAVRASGATVAGCRVAPLTAVHTASDWEITCSTSVRRPVVVWSCVRIETGLVPRVVLQRTARLEVAVSRCAPARKPVRRLRLTGLRAGAHRGRVG